MQIARVVGTVVATQKNRKLEGAKLLLVQPLTLDDEPRGHGAAGDRLGRRRRRREGAGRDRRQGGRRCARARRPPPVDAAIIGIVDAVDGQGCMNEDALRALVRETMRARRPAGAGGAAAGAPRRLHVATHPSHYRYALPQSDGPCLIEPDGAVQPLRLLPVARTLSRGSPRDLWPRPCGTDPPSLAVIPSPS